MFNYILLDTESFYLLFLELRLPWMSTIPLMLISTKKKLILKLTIHQLQKWSPNHNLKLNLLKEIKSPDLLAASCKMLEMPEKMAPVSNVALKVASAQNKVFFVAVGDIFTIDELAIYEGAHNEQTYAVAGDILDGVIYIVT